MKNDRKYHKHLNTSLQRVLKFLIQVEKLPVQLIKFPLYDCSIDVSIGFVLGADLHLKRCPRFSVGVRFKGNSTKYIYSYIHLAR